MNLLVVQALGICRYWFVPHRLQRTIQDGFYVGDFIELSD